MTNINPNGGINRVNNGFKKEDITNNKEKPIAKTKEAEASSLDALNSYGKANVTFKGKLKDSIQKEMFKKKITKNFNLSEFTVNELMKNVNKDNIKFIESLFFAKDENGQRLLEHIDGIESIARDLSADKLEFAEKLIFGEDGKSHGRARGLIMPWGPHHDWEKPAENITYAKILWNLTPENYEFAEKLCFGKDENGEYLFSEIDDVGDILKMMTSDNASFVEKLCIGKDENGNDFFPEKRKILQILMDIRSGELTEEDIFK